MVKAVTVLTLCVIVLTTVMHLYHTQRIVLNATRSQAEFVARQIYFQSAHALSRQPGKDPRAVLARDAELRALLDASVGYDPSLLYALIVDEQGMAIVHTDRRREGERVPPQPRFRDAFPARSPMPLIVHSTCLTPAVSAAWVLATARPRSSWQCALNTALSELGTRLITVRKKS